jgi:hypothetical protein
MTESTAILIGSIPSFIALWLQWRVSLKVELVHKATNSMHDALVKTTRSDALQEGHAAGVAEQKRLDPN